MKSSIFVFATFIALATISTANAMPNFARREGVRCTTCHTVVPKLNRVGYEYRNAGYRFADKIGKDEPKATFENMNTARIQNNVSYTHTNRPAAYVRPNQFKMVHTEATLYPVSGAWGGNWASLAELSVQPEDVFEIENAYIKGVWGAEDSHFNARAGVFHPWEGFGASDRPLGITRALFQTLTANDPSTGSTQFTPWGFDQAGLELGYTYGDFNIAGTIFNGLWYNSAEGATFPFQGGLLNRATTDPNYNKKDYQLFANEFIGKTNAVSAWFYKGTLTLPIPSTPAVSTMQKGWTDDFTRLALYGTLGMGTFVPTLDPLSLMAGQEFGWDKKLTGDAPSSNFRSNGTFVEANYRLYDAVGAGARWDYFSPTNSVGGTKVKAYTLALNGSLLNGAQGIVELKRTDTGRGEGQGNTSITSVNFRMIFIF